MGLRSSTRQVCNIHQIYPRLFLLLNLCSEPPSPSSPTPASLSFCLSSWLFHGWHVCKIQGLLIFLTCSLTSFPTFSSCMNLEDSPPQLCGQTSSICVLPCPSSLPLIVFALFHFICLVLVLEVSDWFIMQTFLKREKTDVIQSPPQDWCYSGASLSNSWGRGTLLIRSPMVPRSEWLHHLLLLGSPSSQFLILLPRTFHFR